MEFLIDALEQIWIALSSITLFSHIGWVGKLLANKALRKYTIKGLKQYLMVAQGKKALTHKILNTKGRIGRIYNIDNTTLSTPLKTSLYQILISIKLLTVTDYLKEWITTNKKAFKTMEKTALKTSMEKFIDMIVNGDDTHAGYAIKMYKRLTEPKCFGAVKGRAYYDLVYTDTFAPAYEKNLSYIYDFFDKFFIYQVENCMLIEIFMDRLDASLVIAASDMRAIISNMNGSLLAIEEKSLLNKISNTMRKI